MAKSFAEWPAPIRVAIIIVVLPLIVPVGIVIICLIGLLWYAREAVGLIYDAIRSPAAKSRAGRKSAKP